MSNKLFLRVKKSDKLFKEFLATETENFKAYSNSLTIVRGKDKP